jgi:hypothetical protein
VSFLESFETITAASRASYANDPCLARDTVSVGYPVRVTPLFEIYC